MLKNKDGSYNKFPLLIICLIALISVIIIGMVMIENVDFPKIYAAPPTPAITPVETYIQKNISYPLIYNATLGVSNTTYTYGDEYKNWSDVNGTTANITYLVVSGGGGAGGLRNNTSFEVSGIIDIVVGVGGPKASYYANPDNREGNSSFSTIAATGGGGGASHTPVTSTTPIKITQPLQTSPTIQNITPLILLNDTFGSNNWVLLIIIVIFSVMVIIFKSRQALTVIVILILFACLFNFIQITNLPMICGMILLTYIIMTSLFGR